VRVVIALGGNALIRRGESPTAETQRRNLEGAVEAIATIAEEHQVVVTHGNGPQVGLLAMQPGEGEGDSPFPLDVLGAETEGMIGYLISQGLRNVLPAREIATLLTQVEVDPRDPAFQRPTKPIGVTYDEEEARSAASRRGWEMAPDGEHWRRVVASPEPRRILDMGTVRLLVDHHVLVVCAGGGGIPVIFDPWGRVHGVEAVIDKDLTAGLLARQLGADALLLLTDVDGIYRDFGGPDEALLREVTPTELRSLALASGSMGPKAEACARFVEATGRTAAVGCLDDAASILVGEAGTRIVPDGDAGGDR
jgi:carbamate kinase